MRQEIEYLIGNYRYFMFNKRPWKTILLRRHIREQIVFRIEVMNKECYRQGSCQLCGCKVTALQMAQKACDAPCYPKMMNKKKWKKFLKGEKITEQDTVFQLVVLKEYDTYGLDTFVSLYKNGEFNRNVHSLKKICGKVN